MEKRSFLCKPIGMVVKFHVVIAFLLVLRYDSLIQRMEVAVF